MNKHSCALFLTIFCAGLFLVSRAVVAGILATWNSAPISGDWNDGSNWSGGVSPNGASAYAIFGSSSITNVTLSDFTTVNRITFNAGASAYTISTGTLGLTITSGAGVTNNSSVIQHIVTASDGLNRGSIVFQNATASPGTGGPVMFVNDVGLIQFQGAHAGNGIFITGGSPDGTKSRGVTELRNHSDADRGTFTSNGALASGGLGGLTQLISGHGGHATFISNGATVNGAGGGVTHIGNMTFKQEAGANAATLIANGGSGGGGGGSIIFSGDARGETARVMVFDNGNLDIGLVNPSVSIGSLEGTGNVFLSNRRLVVGRGAGDSHRSTTFSGVIQDGGLGGLTGGSLGKTSPASLALAGANIYTGGTVVDNGRLLAVNPTGSATGSGAITVNGFLGIGAGVLGGTSTITGAVTVNSRGALMGGTGTTASGSLKLAGNVTLVSGSLIELVVGPSGAHSTLTRTGGIWAFAPNQRFTFLDLGAQPGVYDNIITGLVGDPGGTASWTITNAGFTGTFTYDGAGNIDLTLTAVNGPGFQMTTAVSRKMHGPLGPFDIALPLTGEAGVECRRSNGNHTLVFTFNNNVVAGHADVTTGTGVVESTVFSRNTLTVNLTGVPDAQRLILTLTGLQDNTGGILPDKTVKVNVLVGDTNGNRSVNASDIGQTKAQSGVPVNGANFRADINVSGSVTASDISEVKANAGHTLPAETARTFPGQR